MQSKKVHPEAYVKIVEHVLPKADMRKNFDVLRRGVGRLLRKAKKYVPKAGKYFLVLPKSASD